MKLQTNAQILEWPVVVPVSSAELQQLRTTCEAMVLRGGETGAIAQDILIASNGLTALIAKLDASLKS